MSYGPLRPCKYCSALTRSLYQVCLAHDDLCELDPGFPAALVETRPGSVLGERGALLPVGGSSRQPVRAALDTPETS